MRNTEAPRQRSKAGTLSALLALALLVMVAAICMSLGAWQLDRAAQRDALYQQIQHGRSQSPLALSAHQAATDFIPWQAAKAQGRWLDAYTVLLQNRNFEGRPGYWVATPLLLTQAPLPSSRNDAVSAGSAELDAVTGRSGAHDFLSRGPGAHHDTAVLVLRGWLPRNIAAMGAAPVIPQENGLVQIQGELHTHVPRIFELWHWAGGAESKLPASLPTSDAGVPQVQNLDIHEYARATGLNLLPVVLAQTQASEGLEAGSSTAHTPAPAEVAGDTPATGAPTAHAPASTATPSASSATDTPFELRREWPGPSLDSDQNRGYALQWFGFSAIAIIAALFVTRGLFRRRGQQLE